jgi:hypothetical protein
MLRQKFVIAAAALAALAQVAPASAQVRLIGMTGNQTQGDWNGIPQESLFEVDLTDGSTEFLSRLDFGFDSQAIGYNPKDGMLYRTAGIDAWRPLQPDHYAFNDTQYMEKLDPNDLAPNTPVDTIAIFNADPLQRPNPAPRPSWVYPPEPRTDASEPYDDPEGEKTNDEYHSLRGLAWSASNQLFYGSDEEGIFTMTPEGVSKYVGIPRPDFGDVKGIVILNVDGQEKLYVGTKEQTGSEPFQGSELIEVDMTTGLEISSIVLKDPVLPTIGATGILGMSVHPETGVLYAISRGGSPSDPELRELITINPLTGDTVLIGEVGVNLSSIAFTFPVEPPVGQDGDTDGDGDVDLTDLNAVRNNFGGAGPAGDAYPFDGVVDLTDLNLVRNNFGTVAGSAVPEPSTAILALAGLAAIGYGFRRK